MPKTYILDTSVLVYDSHCLEHYKNSRIIIPSTVIEELDNLKTKNSLVGRNARLIIKKIYQFCKDGIPIDGLSIQNNNVLIIDSNTYNNPKFSCNNNDDKILSCCYCYNGVMVSRDINLLIRAISSFLETEFYESEQIEELEIYSGYKEMDEIIESSEGLDSVIGTPFECLYPNEFVKILCNGRNSLFRRHFDDSLKPVRIPSNIFGIKSKNMQQAMALDLLLDPNVKLCTIVGVGGSGKTLLSLACSLYQTIENKTYSNVELYRAISSFGGGKYSVGYLPGTLEEKLVQWMQPYMDNLNVLLENNVDDYLFRYKNKISFNSLENIRGRTLSSFSIFDETQECSLQDIKGILSRAGQNSKIVLTGDPLQIESEDINDSNNGLGLVIEKFKKYPISGHVTLQKSERSDLASLAVTIL